MPMPKKIKRAVVIIIGIIFVLLGLMGLFLPFLQGILFLVFGLFLLSFYFPKIRGWIKKYAQPHPYLFSKIERVERWIAKILGEM